MEVMGMPKNLNTELEAAVMGREFQEYLRKNNVTHYPVDPQKKRNNAIVERINRTLREMITMYSQDTKNWVGVLGEILENYNNNTHVGTIKAIPAMV
jgi:hypothetical protein